MEISDIYAAFIPNERDYTTDLEQLFTDVIGERIQRLYNELDRVERKCDLLSRAIHRGSRKWIEAFEIEERTREAIGVEIERLKSIWQDRVAKEKEI